MRIVTTERGKTTTLDKRDLARIDNVQLILRILSRECPLIESYGRAKDALDDVTGMFGAKRKIVESFIVKEEEDGPEQPTAGSDPSSPADSSSDGDNQLVGSSAGGDSAETAPSGAPAA